MEIWLVPVKGTPRNVGVVQDEWMLHAVAGCCGGKFSGNVNPAFRCSCGLMTFEAVDVGEWGAAFKLFAGEKPHYLTDWIISWTGIPREELEVGIDYGVVS